MALEAGADPGERAGAVRRAHEEFVTGGGIGAPVRHVVAESWRRCAGASLAPEGVARVDLTDDALEDHRLAHPLAGVMPLFRELLGTVADDGAHLLSVFDGSGRMLWAEGHAQVMRRAERMNFVPGSRWAEDRVGTNGPGTALAVDHAVQIFASEHYSRHIQSWTCAAAPVHDPRTHRIIGAVDITGGNHLASPQSLALVQATARAAEAALADRAPRASGRPVLSVLGRDEALLATGDGGRLRLGRRHSELLLLLAAHPDGLTGERLAVELYGDRDVNPVTLRAELSRLRSLLGPLVASRPYRLTQRLATDHDAVSEALAAGDLSGALAAYEGPPLPSSEAPGVLRLRRLLEDRLRRRLLARRDPAQLESWVRAPWGEDDLEAWEALHAALTGGPGGPLLVGGPGTRAAVGAVRFPRRGLDPLETTAAVRVRELRDAYGLDG
nr:helix-turn-helix domain-containing protein [Streptomyces sp. HNM0574]